MSRASLIGALAAAVASSALAQLPQPRQVAAPASDVAAGVVRLPDPAATPTISRAALRPLRFEPSSGAGWAAEVEFEVERDGDLAIGLIAPAPTRWRVLAAPPGAPLRPLDEGGAISRRIEPAGELLPGWLVDRRDLRGARGGTWRMRLESDERVADSEGWLAVRASGDVRAEAFVTTHLLVAGERIAVAARASGRDPGSVTSARVVLRTADVERELAMRDDGASGDGEAGDGLYGALVPEEARGDVLARVEILGTTREGRTFERGLHLAFPVLEPVLALDGAAAASDSGTGRWRIEIGAVPLGHPQRLHTCAEVWGRGESGEPEAVCWLSRIAEPEPRGGAWSLALDLDLRWLDVSAARAPFELRAVRVQDPDTESVLAFAERVELAAPPLVRARGRAPAAVVPAMLASPNLFSASAASLPGAFPPATPATIAPALMLVHGYCSGGSIWPAADFAPPKLEFLDPNANRTHDQFAQLIAQRADAAGLSSFGVVAHSQGGPASLHLFTYYASGLDAAAGGRRIQSLASPYQGTPLASWGGFACGTNQNLTPSGAATWLAGIPSWARAEVHTWTTANSGSVCNAFTALLLSDPEDGVVEKYRAELPGGNNMGHKTGWCHTTGMSNPASYTDHARNVEMDAQAAR
jgi:hypothetical protein